MSNSRYVQNSIISVKDKIREMYYRYLFNNKSRIEKIYYKRLGRNVNLETPERFTDKQQWLKLNWYDPLAVMCADKYSVRVYVSNKIGSKYLNEILGVYDSTKDISFASLPNQF